MLGQCSSDSGGGSDCRTAPVHGPQTILWNRYDFSTIRLIIRYNIIPCSVCCYRCCFLQGLKSILYAVCVCLQFDSIIFNLVNELPLTMVSLHLLDVNRRARASQFKRASDWVCVCVCVCRLGACAQSQSISSWLFAWCKKRILLLLWLAISSGIGSSSPR